jgi:aminomethyltransferase
VTGIDAQADPSRATSLLSRHLAFGARMIDFGGWRMPLSYTSIREEHRAVRERAGMFDMSNTGALFVEGLDAGEALAAALASDPLGLAIGRAQDSILCAVDGGIIDDPAVYRLAEDRFLVVASAINASAVSDALAERLDGSRSILDDRSLATALVAVHGPAAARILAPLADADLSGLAWGGIAEGAVAGIPALVARTGRTGEDGFEIFVESSAAPELWDIVTAAGAPAGLLPVGLGARDTLRLEAGIPLSGSELDRSTTPFEAGLGAAVALTRAGDFVGRDALVRAAAAAPRRALVGLIVRARGIARHGYPLWAGERRTGAVTSGTLSPTLGLPIAMAYVAPGDAAPGTMLEVEIRSMRVAAEVVPLPFYSRAR